MPWPAIVTHLEQLLTDAIGTETGGMWWEPEEDEAGQVVFRCKLPTADEVSRPASPVSNTAS